MIIINADDWGSDNSITDQILECIEWKQVDSVSAMVFMKDSKRAADIANERSIDTGLHLNFTLPFTSNVPQKLRKSQGRIISFLKTHKIAQVLYNPFIKDDFAYVYKKQVDEYTRLYQKKPLRIDGHNHMHLCANMLWGKLIPADTFVRRNYSFLKNEKTFFNRIYRAVIDSVIKRRYICTDYFFHIQQCVNKRYSENNNPKNSKIFRLANKSLTEILVHPNQEIDNKIINSRYFQELLTGIQRSSFREIMDNKKIKPESDDQLTTGNGEL